MAFFKKILIFIVSLFLQVDLIALSDVEQFSDKQILYFLHKGDLNRSFELYQDHKQALGRHDLDLLQRMALTLLDQGARSSDPQIRLLTLFGASMSCNDRALYILEQGIFSREPELQLVAVNLLAKSTNTHADEILNKVLGSPHLLLRLEALLHLAEKKHPKAVGQVESLMAKVDEKLIPIFPQLFAMIGDAPAIRALKRLLSHPRVEVRVAAISAAAKHNRDDLLPQIRRLASQHDTVQQEACAVALGVLQDEKSIHKLEVLSRSISPGTRLAAAQALYRLGNKDAKQLIVKMAEENNVFAIAALGEIKGSESILRSLVQSSNIQVRLNAAAALLELRDADCMPALSEILVHDARDLAFAKTSSLSGSLTTWKVIPSANANGDLLPAIAELSLSLREKTLIKCLELPREEFLKIAEMLFQKNQTELIPALIELLQNIRSKEAIALLKKYREKTGAPLIRNYCNLALFKLKEPGPYREMLRSCVNSTKNEDFIKFRAYVPIDIRQDEIDYELNPEQSSKLLIAILESFAQTQEDAGLDLLLEAILNGNRRNRFALAGLLIRAAM